MGQGQPHVRISLGFEAMLLGFRSCSDTNQGKLLYVSVPQFLYLLNEDKINSIYLIGLLQELHELIPIKNVEQCLTKRKHYPNADIIHSATISFSLREKRSSVGSREHEIISNLLLIEEIFLYQGLGALCSLSHLLIRGSERRVGTPAT